MKEIVFLGGEVMSGHEATSVLTRVRAAQARLERGGELLGSLSAAYERLLGEFRRCEGECEWLRSENARLRDGLLAGNAEGERLRAALQALLGHADATVLSGWRDVEVFENARRALEGGKE